MDDLDAQLTAAFNEMCLRRDGNRCLDALMTAYDLTKEKFFTFSKELHTREGWSFYRDRMSAIIYDQNRDQPRDGRVRKVLTAIDTYTQLVDHRHAFLLEAHDPTVSPHAAVAAHKAYEQFVHGLYRVGGDAASSASADAPAFTPRTIADASLYVVDDDVNLLVQNLLLTRSVDPTWLDLVPPNVIVLISDRTTPFITIDLDQFPELKLFDTLNIVSEEQLSTLAMQMITPIIGLHRLTRGDTSIICPLVDNIKAFVLSDFVIREKSHLLLSNEDYWDILPNIVNGWANATLHLSTSARDHQIFPAYDTGSDFIWTIPIDDEQDLDGCLRESIERIQDYKRDTHRELSGSPVMFAYLAALFALMRDPALIGQERQVLGQRPIPKSERRYDSVTGRRIKTTDVAVTTVHLSQGEGSLNTCSETERHYSHRWIVSGHWRMQPCGPHQSERKRIWINPHVQGPADKPLIIKDRVTRVRL